MGDLSKIVRKAVLAIDKGDLGTVHRAALPVATELLKRGLGPNCHVPRTGLEGEEIIEWYAGQLLHIVATESWYAMNSFINSLDRFVPAAEHMN